MAEHLLNDKFVDTERAELLKKKAQLDIEKVRKAVARLKWAELPVGSDQELRELSHEKVDARIENAISEWKAQAAKMLLDPKSVDTALERYEETRQELTKHVDTLNSIMSEYKGVSFKIDSKGRPWFNEKELDNFIKESSTYFFTEVDKKYYNALGHMIDGFNELLTIEKDNSLLSFLRRDVQNPYSGGIVNLYDRSKECFRLDRTLFVRMKHLGLIMGHAPTAEDMKNFREKYSRLPPLG